MVSEKVGVTQECHLGGKKEYMQSIVGRKRMLGQMIGEMKKRKDQEGQSLQHIKAFKHYNNVAMSKEKPLACFMYFQDQPDDTAENE